MATGDTQDILSRLMGYLPRGWFGSNSPIITALMTGIAAVYAPIYAMVIFFQAQTRLQSSSGGWIDLFAADFFGNTLPRNLNETDQAYITRIQLNLLQERATRPAMVKVLTNLTGFAPIIFEPMNPADTGCYSSGAPGFYGVARFGSLAAPFSALITAYRPKASGGNLGAAYMNAAAWSAFSTPLSHGYYGSLADETTSVSDQAIYDAINLTRPIATNVGVAILNHP
ncbi:hypothetical protein HNQ50_000320 [Silvimonas terrae]|uniref:Uncharacterized protein n=1 Tax=Silvimonas terrae TaxID=300266 RepID=A0A840RB86_9NEIS|nr:hypothetical protein [Silvimonas terrae]MBB5189610.1 hypothetical protein [Silvimonas terrae]